MSWFAKSPTNLLPLLAPELNPKMQAAARVVADELRARLAAGPRSGTHWEGDPRQASAPGEPEQEQTGGLRDSVDVRIAGALFDVPPFEVGFFDHDMNKLRELELNPEKATYRGTLLTVAEDPTTHAAMLRAVRDDS